MSSFLAVVALAQQTYNARADSLCRIESSHVSSAKEKMMRNFRLWIYLGLAVSSLALSGAQPAAAWGMRHAACYPAASWVTMPPNVCIKYVCAGGGFHIRCLPAPH